MTAQNKNIPALRFKEYDDKWNNKKLHEICEKLSVGFVGTCEKFYTDENKGVLLVRTGNLSGGHIILDNVKYVEEEFNSKNKKSQIFPGDLLIARHGSSGQAVLVPENFPRANCLNIVILRASKLFDSYFLQNKFNSEALQIQIKRKTAGTTQGVINTSELATLTVSYPSLPEQQKIASFLSAVDEKILQLTRKKELMEQYKQGVMQKLFSGKLRFKDEKGRAYPEWEEKRLGDVCVVNPKNNGLPDSFIYIDLESVEKGQLKRENRINREDAPSRAQRSMNKNDILYQTVRPYQMNNLFFDKPGEYVASTGYAQLRTNENARFIYQILHTDVFVNEVLDRCTGTSFPAIKSSDLAQIVIGIPQIYEQNKIATFLSSIDAKIEGIGNQINKSQMFKKGLLQQMFV